MRRQIPCLITLAYLIIWDCGGIILKYTFCIARHALIQKEGNVYETQSQPFFSHVAA